MKIERIEIDRFGGFVDQTFGPLDAPISIFFTPDGRSSRELLAFIQAVLGGFQPARLPEIERERFGGRLHLCDASNRTVLVERHSDLMHGSARISVEGGRTGGDALLAELFAPLPLEIYLEIFAPGSGGLDVRAFTGPDALFPARPYPDDATRRLRARRAAISGELRDVQSKLAAIERPLGRVSHLARVRAATLERISQARAELAGIESAIARTGTGGDGHSTHDRPADALRLRMQIDELRETWTRLQATRRMSEVYGETVARQSTPRGPAFMAVMAAGSLLPLLAGALTGQHVIIALGAAATILGAVMLVLATIARTRFDTAQMQAQMQLEITRRDAEARYLHAAMAAGIDERDIHGELERLQALLRAAEAAQRAREETRELEDSRAAAKTRLSGAAAELEAIDREMSVALDEWTALAVATGLDAAEHPDEARASLERSRDELLIESGRVDQQLRQLLDEPNAGIMRRRAGALSMAGPEFRDRALRAASDALEAMTLGAYHRLEPSPDSGDLRAVSRDGVHTPIGHLERGVNSAACLALHIGLIRAVEAQSGSRPVLVDDILVPLDRGLARETARALVNLSDIHQVLLFTAHRETVELARQMAPSLRVIVPSGRPLSRLDPVWLDND